MSERIMRILKRKEGRMAAPLMGYPGTQLTGTTIKQNEFNWGIQFWTIQTLVREFAPDIAFFFMDLAIEASALGLPVRYPLQESPTVEYHMVANVEDLEQFMMCDILKDGRVIAFTETMKMMANSLDVYAGAYVIGPFTLAGLMMGASDIAMATITDPKLVHSVLTFATRVVKRYARALSAAGAHMICVLDPTAVMLSPASYAEFAGGYTKEVFESVPDSVGLLHVCGNTSHLITAMVATGAEGLSLDSLVDMKDVAGRVPEDVVLIGNIDPVRVMMHPDVEFVRTSVERLLDEMAPYPNFILSTACDLPANTPLANISAFMEAGRRYESK